MTGGALLGMVVTNGLLVLCTLGIGYAWARVRAIGFYCDCVTMIGPADFAAIRQEALPAEATGEGHRPARRRARGRGLLRPVSLEPRIP